MRGKSLTTPANIKFCRSKKSLCIPQLDKDNKPVYIFRDIKRAPLTAATIREGDQRRKQLINPDTAVRTILLDELASTVSN